ncbi:hypothetical protein ACIQRW_13910 [Streptomyces sp. NPDC091287]|uniref:hypothetical protein n=1 Tax=Streptomyces sp. NPDC091287 TaxID=3365988 RepID=UPI003800D615
MGLGSVFGRRLLLPHHTGRNSGLDRRVALEVVAHDRGAGGCAGRDVGHVLTDP